MRKSLACASCNLPLVPLIGAESTNLRTPARSCVRLLAHKCASLLPSSYERTKSTRQDNQDPPESKGNHTGHPRHRSRHLPLPPTANRNRRTTAHRSRLARHLQVPRHPPRRHHLRGRDTDPGSRPGPRTNGPVPPQQGPSRSMTRHKTRLAIDQQGERWNRRHTRSRN